MTEEQRKELIEKSRQETIAAIGVNGKKIVDAAFDYGMEITMAVPVDDRKLLDAAVEFWKDKLDKKLISIEQLPELKDYLEG